MITNRITILFALLTLNFMSIISQTSYDKGYFISTEGIKTECLIENKEWEICPIELSYKVTEQGDQQRIKTSKLKEFEIFGSSKYISRVVEIDKSRSEISELSPSKNPVWLTEKLFLKVLVEGKASLYMYNEYNLTRFFYSVNDTSINQLVYKQYQSINENGTMLVATNNNFRQQLYVEVNIPDYSADYMTKIAYEQHELKRYFTKYNAQFNTNQKVIVKEKIKKDFLKIRVTAGLNQRTVVVKNLDHRIGDYDFGNFISPTVGAELEFSVPFTNNKWSVLFHPSYNFPIESVVEQKRYYDDKPFINEFNYQSFEVPFGIRYRYFINTKMSLYANGFVSNRMLRNYKSTIKIEHLNLDVFESANRYSAGLGLEYEKLSMELRGYENRNLLEKYNTRGTDFKGFSLFFKYKFVDLKLNK